MDAALNTNIIVWLASFYESANSYEDTCILYSIANHAPPALIIPRQIRLILYSLTNNNHHYLHFSFFFTGGQTYT